MREHAVRRLPVVEDGSLVGVVSIGDLARSKWTSGPPLPTTAPLNQTGSEHLSRPKESHAGFPVRSATSPPRAARSASREAPSSRRDR